MSKLLLGIAGILLAATPAIAQQDRFADPRPVDFTQPWNTDINRGRQPGPPALTNVRLFTTADATVKVLTEIPMDPAVFPRATGDGKAQAPAVADTGADAAAQKPADELKAAPDKAQP